MPKSEGDSTFITVAKTAQAEITIKKSLFIARVSSAASEEESRDFCRMVRRQGSTARHNVSAFRVGVPGTSNFVERFSDDGEPRGTAGKPVFDCISGRNLTNTVVVVTRYFGGILLGTGGLGHAYSTVAATALDLAGQQVMTLKNMVEVELPYNLADVFRYYLRKQEINILEENYGTKINYLLALTSIEQVKLEEHLADISAGTVKARFLYNMYMR
jgi:hypothetical protein